MQNLEDDRRRAERFPLSIDLKFLLQGRHEATGMLLDISETGLALLSETQAEEGDDIVVYPIGLGRLAGKVVRAFDGGIGVQFALAKGQREIIRERLAAVLGGVPYMRLSEKRTSFRIRYNIDTHARIEGQDKTIACTIKDMSKTGCLLKADSQPPIGAEVTLGTLRGRVVRHIENGFAMEFHSAAAQAGAPLPPRQHTA
ncbi:PilZ domain-containing protein [Hyphococcus luteus]|uniref:PilZ domain-containing protein n=1 Tax=Hyphococcus luteus TaxID=2058213 RepID=A0A2S7K0Q8_9PROT|nr:PilZ domain-containing protein [Marinicaulis flavus]PQA86056.1 hypothetical protein CW354_16915 [Marinicaulis flavus]